MTIEIKEFANVNISVSPSGVSGGNFGIEGFLTLDTDLYKEGAVPISPEERGRSYSGIDSVGEDWDADSEVYKAATAFYAATPTPTDFVAIINVSSSVTTSLTSTDASSTIGDYTALGSTASFSVEVNETVYQSETIDLSLVADLDDVANAISAAIGYTVTHVGGQFLIEAGTSSEDTIQNVSGTASTVTGLDDGVFVSGATQETPVQSLALAVDASVPFVGLVTHRNWRDLADTSEEGDSTTLDIADWCEANKKIFFNTTNDPKSLLTTSAGDVASKLKDKTLRFSLTTYSSHPSEYPSAAVFGRAASVNFSAANSTITLNLKQIPTVTAENLTNSQFQALKAKHASAVIQIGKTVNAYSDSKVASGSWLDTTHGLLWLEDRCETDMFNLLYQTTTKIPYTQAGLNTAANRLSQSLRAAVINGLAGAGFLPDGTYLPEGFRVNVVQLADIPSGDKSQRVYNGLSFDMVGAGALQELTISGNFAE